MLVQIKQTLSLDSRPLYLALAVTVAVISALAPEILAVIFAIAILAYFWKHRDQFVIFILIYTPFEELVLKMLPDSMYAYARYFWEAALFLMMILIITEKAILTRKWKPSPVDSLVILFICVWIASTFLNIKPLFSSVSILKNIVRYIPLFYIIYNLKPDRRLLIRIVHAIIIIGIIESIICIGQAFDSSAFTGIFRPKDVIVGGKLIRGTDVQLGSYHTRFTGSFARSNDLGNYLVFAICLLIGAYFKIRKRPVYLFGLAILLVALFLSSSRISWISAYMAVGAILVYAGHRLRRIYIAIPAAAALILIGGIISIKSKDAGGDFEIVSRFANMFTEDYIDIISETGRLYAVQQVVPVVLKSAPVLGLGPGSFLKISRQMSDEEVYGAADRLGLESEPLTYVHDVGYATLLVQVGLLGTFIFVLIFVRIFKLAVKACRKSPDDRISAIMLGAIGLLIAVAIQNLASFNVSYRNQSVLIWIVCGLVALYSGATPISKDKITFPDGNNRETLDSQGVKRI